MVAVARACRLKWIRFGGRRLPGLVNTPALYHFRGLHNAGMDPAQIASPLTALDIAQRGALFVLLLFLGLWVWRHHRQHLSARLGVAFVLGVACNVLYFVPGFVMAPAALWQVPILAIGVSNSALFWIFSSALFNDDFRLRWFHGAAWVIVAAAAVCACHGLMPPSWERGLGWIPGPAAVLFALLSVIEALRTWQGDLVERRRNLRLFIVLAAGGHVLLSSLAQMALHPRARPGWFSLVDVFAMLVITLLVLWRILGLRDEQVFGPRGAPQFPAREAQLGEPGAVPAADEVMEGAPATLLQPGLSRVPAPLDAPGPGPSDPPDPRLLARLQALMREERVYRDDNLSIGALASRMNLPEHRLRRLINQGLGYRNFISFLNEYRLEDARQALRDPGLASTSILDIALQCGFGSLGPFNRAFKQATGLTPSEFRRG